MAVMQMQIQALLAAQEGVGARGSNRVQCGIPYGGGQASHLQWRGRESRGICDSMLVIYKDKVERKYGRRTGAVGVNICVGRIGRCVEGKYDGGIRISGSRI